MERNCIFEKKNVPAVFPYLGRDFRSKFKCVFVDHLPTEYNKEIGVFPSIAQKVSLESSLNEFSFLAYFSCC